MSEIAEKPSRAGQPQIALTNDERLAFLAEIAEGKSMRQAAEAVGRGRATIAFALQRDPDFAAAFEQAYEASADILEEVAWTRATVPDKWGKTSDRLLEFLMSARNPKRYRSKTAVEVTGAGGGPVTHVVAHVDEHAVLATLAAAGLIAPELPVRKPRELEEAT